MSGSYRNVMIVIADDWSPLAACYGNNVIRTPNIDALAAQGTVFDNAFCTSPSCAVSRANLLTGYYSHTHGQYGHSHGIHGFRTHEHIRSVPAVLNSAGIRTGLIGKSHVAPQSVYPFDLETLSDPLSPRRMCEDMRGFFDTIGNDPFFLHFASMYPHRSFDQYRTGDEHADEFDDYHYSPDEVVVPDFLPDNDATRQDLADYYIAVSRYDHVVGQAVQQLRELGRDKDTLILVMTDHAMPFPGAKASSFDSGHRCPFIAIKPDQENAGIHSNALMNWSNIAPTIYEWCGIPAELIPSDLPEQSLVNILEEESPQGWDETYFSHCFHEITNYYPYRVLRGRRYKYVRNLASKLQLPFPTDIFRSITWQRVLRDNIEMMGQRPTQRLLFHDREELFDIQNDPAESTNLIDDPALADVVSQMRSKVIEFRTSTRDPWLETSFQEGEVTSL